MSGASVVSANLKEAGLFKSAILSSDFSLSVDLSQQIGGGVKLVKFALHMHVECVCVLYLLYYFLRLISIRQRCSR